MKNRICPKCDGTEIYTSVEATMIKQKMTIDAWSSPANIDIFMCVNCGYLEYYVTRPMDRERVAQKWKRAN